jgi:hypothetical protein
MKADSRYAANTVRKKATMSPTEVLIEPRSNLVLRKASAIDHAGLKRPT